VIRLAGLTLGLNLPAPGTPTVTDRARAVAEGLPEPLHRSGPGAMAAADEAADLAGDPTDHDRGGTLAFTGFLLSLLSVLTILFVGLPALVLPSC
jgi:hypothetical protein